MKIINKLYFCLFLLNIINFSLNSCQEDCHQIENIRNERKKNIQTSYKNLLSLATSILGLQKLISEYSREFKFEDQFCGHDQILNCIIYSKCGKYLVYVGWDNYVKIWNILNRRLERKIKIEEDMVNSISICPIAKYLATGNINSDSNISIWEFDTTNLDKKPTDGICKQKLNSHNNSINSISYSPCGKFIASGASDSIIRIWDLNINKIIISLNIKDIINEYSSSKKDIINTSSENDQYIVSAICYSKDGHSLAFGCVKNVYEQGVWTDQPILVPHPKCDNNISIIDLGFAKLSGKFIGHKDRVSSISCNNNQMASSSYDKTIRIWDLETKMCLQIFKETECITSVSFSPCDNFLVASVCQMIKIWKNHAYEVFLSPLVDSSISLNEKKEDAEYD